MIGVVIACGIILSLAVVGTIYRLAKGPSLLDRVIATDVLLAIVGAAISVDMVYRDSYENLTLLVVVALVGFMGSVTVARFANNKRDPGEESQDAGRARGRGGDA
ncbi:monovalent cation/H+ antiporter complex subunit F [Rothia halotolerans]|uniref:monovalent cation/H+ antiporter complex subunit F n=1 Tax=Rothia halotolerans TaxID=405770 RepID=UPI00101B63D8|nr:monovalent cation/H+ antiporter complex subunit F [Rothia halotolerans]